MYVYLYVHKKKKKLMKHSAAKNNVSAMYPIRLKYVERKKIEIVASDKGRKVSEHLHWLIAQSIRNYESTFGEIELTTQERTGK
jgi:hypothetical protein